MEKIKALIIPHRKNGYRPHAIRSHGLLVFAIYIITFQTIYNFQTGGEFRVLGYATNVNTSELLSLSNAKRSSSGLASYSKSVRLTQAAQAKANHMIADDYWAHYAPDGTTPWSFIDNAGYSYARAGENLAYGFATSSGVVEGWMDSPAHKANVLDGSFVHVGFGIANGENFQGGKNTVIVALYGEPVVAAPAPAPDPVITSTPSTVADSSTPTVKNSQAPEPEVQPEPVKVEEETNDVNSQRLLARLAEQGGVVVTGEAAAIDAGDGKITNIQALFGGQAHWSLYMVVGGMMAMALIYFARHLQAIGQMIVHGEHFVVGHPTLEASIIYLAVWLMMFATFGAVI